MLEYLDGSINRKEVYVHFTGLLDNVMGIITLVYRYGNFVWRGCNLSNCINDQTVIFFAVV